MCQLTQSCMGGWLQCAAYLSSAISSEWLLRGSYHGSSHGNFTFLGARASAGAAASTAGPSREPCPGAQGEGHARSAQLVLVLSIHGLGLESFGLQLDFVALAWQSNSQLRLSSPDHRNPGDLL